MIFLIILAFLTFFGGMIYSPLGKTQKQMDIGFAVMMVGFAALIALECIVLFGSPK